MRSYSHYCGLAKALDVIGDRWTLLVVRELLLLERARYTDLQRGLPGVATNLLAARLRELEEAGVVRREELPPPAPATLYSLTEWGVELKPIVLALGRWASPVLMHEPAEGDVFRSYWLALSLEANLEDRFPTRRPIAIELRIGDEPVRIETAGGRVRVRRGAATEPSAILSGPPATVFQFLAGRIDLAAAKRGRVRLEGDATAVERIRPAPRIGRPSRSRPRPSG